MQHHQRGLNQEFKREVEHPTLNARKMDWESILPLELIREHTKTDDVPQVSDTQLRLYRRAALEAAQEYTGLLVTGQKVITEDASPPDFTYRKAYQGAWFNHETSHPFAQNFVWYYGLKSMSPQRVPVEIGATVVRLPRQFDDFGMGCCNPCGSSGLARIQYVSGFSCEEDIPAAISLGALKYVAHVIENPGDLITAMTSSGGKIGTGLGVGEPANPAWASGAIDIWRVIKKDAI